MVELLTGLANHTALSSEQLIKPGEVIVIVDDSPEIVLLFHNYLTSMGFTVFQAATANDLYLLLDSHNVALIVLDIGLPDKNGIEILEDIVPTRPDLGIIMMTGRTDLDTGLACLSKGADDYLTKPVSLNSFTHSFNETLAKRRLAIDNRRYQKELETTTFHTHFLHKLNLRMNTAYLSTLELDSVLQTILVGITAAEGLRFNRAFLLLFDDTGEELQGRIAIGPACREVAGEVWQKIKQQDLNLDDILHDIPDSNPDKNQTVNQLVKQLTVSASRVDHILVKAALHKKSILVQNGKAGNTPVPEELPAILKEKTFVIVPLYSPSKSLGVIIADNFVTHNPISEEDIETLEIFASQASLAIEHSNLYREMENKVREAESVTHELEKNKDLLIEAERYSAIGHMSAQLVHAIRNPITSLGGTARLLTKKTTDPKTLKFLHLMTREAEKIETTLEDLFHFVEQPDSEKTIQPLYPLIRKSVMLFYGNLKKQNITYQLDLPEPSPELNINGRKIRQLFLHLIRNAVEAMPEGGILVIRAWQDAKQITITLTDSGIGMLESTLAKVTAPFFTTKTYGTGMGLTLVEQIAREHGGSLTLQHGDEGGMVVTITLPSPP